MNTIQTLDRKRSFGTVYGHPSIGFEQDQRPYRHDGTLHVEPEKPAASVEAPPAQPAAVSPEVLKVLEGLSSQIKDLKPESKAPDPARSEAARRIWAERRAREAEATNDSSSTEPAQP